MVFSKNISLSRVVLIFSNLFPSLVKGTTAYDEPLCCLYMHNTILLQELKDVKLWLCLPQVDGVLLAPDTHPKDGNFPRTTDDTLDSFKKSVQAVPFDLNGKD